MAQFSNDLIMDILMRLPVKTLLCFKCVSKEWCDLIESKDFVKIHLNQSILTKTNHKLILHSSGNPSTLYSVGLRSLDQALRLVHPNRSSSLLFKLIGSCNGLVCLLHRPFGGAGDTITLWNIATRKHVKLPYPVVKNHFLHPGSVQRAVIVHGFGYDSVSDDYKVVQLVIVNDRYERILSKEANIYSLRSNSWVKILDFPGHNLRNKNMSGALACGALHWIVSKHEVPSKHLSALIVALDLVTEEFRTVALPDFHLDEKIQYMVASELGGCLSIACSGGIDKDKIVDVWVMKDYGVKESWTHLFSFSGSEIINSSLICTLVIPLAYSESDEDEILLMVINFQEFLWYDIERKTAKFIEVSGLPGYLCDGIFSYLESLVSLGEKAENDGHN